MHLWSRALACLAAALAVAGARAHDTWFQALGAASATPLLVLGTGNRYPRHEFPIGAEQLAQRGCRSGDGRAAALSAVRLLPHALLLQAAPADGAPDPRAAPQSCWAQLVPFEVALAPEVVEVYLAEIAAPPRVRAAWAAMRSRGVTVWHERFIKHARIELGGVGAAPLPSGMGMDVLLHHAPGPIRPADTLRFELQRDGRPLAQQAMELIDAQGASGGWFESDAGGRIELPAPAPGRWVLRGTDLRVSEADPDRWDSRFVNLAFEVERAAVRTAAP